MFSISISYFSWPRQGAGLPECPGQVETKKAVSYSTASVYALDSTKNAKVSKFGPGRGKSVNAHSLSG
jgi:hypothetical protein